MILLLNDVDWDTFTKIIELSITPTTDVYFDGIFVIGDRVMNVIDTDDMGDDLIFAYKRMDNVIEWNVCTNTIELWYKQLCNLIELITFGDENDILDDVEFKQLVYIHGLLHNTIDEWWG